MSRRHVSAFYTNTVAPVCAPRRQVIPSSRCFSVGSVRRTAADSKPGEQHENTKSQDESKKEEEQGAMARRLSEMTEQAVLEGGRSAQRNMQQAGFSDELKQQLEERVAAAAFKNEYAAAHSIVDMPVCLLYTYHSSDDNQLLTSPSQAQAKEHETSRALRHGPEQKPPTTSRYECWTTPRNAYAHHTRFPSQTRLTCELARSPKIPLACV